MQAAYTNEDTAVRAGGRMQVDPYSRIVGDYFPSKLQVFRPRLDLGPSEGQIKEVVIQLQLNEQT